MLSYIVLYTCAFSFALVDLVSYKNGISRSFELNRKALLFFSFLLFFSVSAFRYRTGSDFKAYEEIFRTSISLPRTRFEAGYLFINSLIRTFTDDFYVLQFFISIFTSICFYNFIKKYSPLPLVSICFYLCSLYLTLNLGFLRQLIAISFFLIAFDKYIQNKKWQVVIIILIAVMFHVSAFTYFILFFINGKKYNRVVAFIGIFGTIFFALNFERMKFLFGLLLELPLPPMLKAMIRFYTTSDTASTNWGFWGWIPRRLIVWFVLFFRKPQNKEEIIIYKIVVLGLMLEVLAIAYINAQRVAWPFVLFENIAIAYFFTMLKSSKSNKRWFYNTCFVVLLFYFVWGPFETFVRSNQWYDEVYKPYYSVFFREEYIPRVIKH